MVLALVFETRAMVLAMVLAMVSAMVFETRAMVLAMVLVMVSETRAMVFEAG